MKKLLTAEITVLLASLIFGMVYVPNVGNPPAATTPEPPYVRLHDLARMRARVFYAKSAYDDPKNPEPIPLEQAYCRIPSNWLICGCPPTGCGY